ncbi:hypothetical protein PYW08_015901 [Mythimna loreyi]|uniref:Uncharacterized protein n=1 Tax=Mythimna loreyi TaxID=667449 RepID=A0ACC2QUL2_9NEOP|nr:hypothetical protein PYW08_015901 [Mythimna loreyi]
MRLLLKMGVTEYDWDSYNGYYSGEESVGSINTMSICKSELLFSPVKEGGHGVHFSVDSLDCELPSEQDLILTCQANKDNYTIAFEGSLTTYSEDSECIELAVNQIHDKLGEEETLVLDNDERTRRNLELLERCKKITNKLTTSMARSDLGLTTWSKLKKQTSQSPLRRHPSGNNNEGSSEATDATNDNMSNSVIKSQSLPNLYRRKLMNSSINSTALSNSTVDSFTVNQRLMGTPICMKVYDVSQHRSSQGSQHSEPMSTSSTDNQTSSDKSQPKQTFSLVKLFMKQKSMSNDGIVSMDQLDRSECWPSSSGGESGESMGEQKLVDSKTAISERPQIDLPSTAVEEVSSLVYEEINPVNPFSNRVYDEVLIEEEETGDGAKLSDSESNLYATVNKPHIKRTNLNIVNSPSRMRSNRKSCSSQSSATSVSISSCSESDGTQITRMNRLLQREQCDHKSTSTHLEADTIDKSIQTSSMNLSTMSQRELFKVIEPSFLEKLKEGDCEKPVFVLYPSYTLPDISFLNGRPNIYLNPLKINVSPRSNESKRNRLQAKGKRPFSCNDLEMLKKKGVGHIKDWDSLNFLLPVECRQLLSEVPELMQHMKEKEGLQKCGDKYCNASPASRSKNRPISCDCNNLAGNTTAVSSSSSTATQPSSGYRGSSTMLTDSSAQNSPAPAGNFNPLFVYRYDSATSSEASGVNNDGQRINPNIPKRSLSLADQNRIPKQGELAPPRPPLPKSILRKSMDKTRKSSAHAKRYSMFEMDDLLQDPVVCMMAATEHKTKRRSLQEPYYLQNQTVDYRKNNDIAAKRLSQQFLDAAEKDADYNEYYPDEGVGTESSLESGKSNELKFHRPHTPPLPKPRTKKMDYTEFPPPGALISSADLQQLEEFLKHSGFNCLNMDEWDQNQVQKGKNLAEIPICEEAEVSPDEFGSPVHHDTRGKYDIIDVSQKRALVSNVTDAVEMLIQHFSPATDQAELAFLGDSKESPACAKIALNALCPALYAIFRDGLKENIETSFGAVNNSVWQMVEATARQGPITKSLNELVLRINSEDAVTEGLVKFNAFILGLLNAQSVDAWVSYIRTRESILAKHYSPDSLILAGCVGEPRCRALLDTLLASLEPLKLLPFSLDLMFEMRELHRSFKKIESDMRAASRLECSGEENWRPGSASSGASGNTGNGSGNSGGGKFRRLQLKWEMLSNAESPVTPSGETSPAAARGSKIPRPVSSPVRPVAPALQSPAKNTAHRGIPVPVRKGTSPTTSTPSRPTTARAGAANKKPPQAANRVMPEVTAKRPDVKPRVQNVPVVNGTNVKKTTTSRVDGAGHGGAAPRPSSLPYGRTPPPAAPRRAASSSAARAHHTTNQQKQHKYVRTLWHRLPSDSGHLAFNEGERLRLILEVDDQYLLCCRGEHKGLVPRDAVLLEDF